jgi:hypothetical protein
MIRDVTFILFYLIFHLLNCISFLFSYISYCILTVNEKYHMMNDLCSLGSDVVYCCILRCCALCVSMINIVTDHMTNALHSTVCIYNRFSI